MGYSLPLDRQLPLVGRLTEVSNALLVPPNVRARPRPCGVFVEGRPVEMSLCFEGSASEPVSVFPEPRAPVRHLAGTYLYGGILSDHFGHMLCEGTGRLWALAGRTDVAGILFFPQPAHKAPNCAKAFAPLARLLQLPEVSVLVDPVTVDHLLVPEQGMGSGELMMGRPEVRAYLRDRLSRAPANAPGRRLYLTRTGQPRRRGMILGEQGLEQLFAAQGYEIIRPERLSLKAQIRLYHEASHVVGTEGSAFHLLALAGRSGCRVAMIKRRQSPLFQLICDQLETFLGTGVARVDEVQQTFSPRKFRDPNFIFLEMSRTAMWHVLQREGFVSGEPWQEMDEAERLAAVNWLQEGINKRLGPARPQSAAPP